jgi:hypothetical protein
MSTRPHDPSGLVLPEALKVAVRSADAEPGAGGAVYYIAKLLQALALFLLLDGLYIGIQYGDMQTELMLLLGGMVLFFIGHRLSPGREK